MAQNGILTEDGPKQKLHPTLHRILFCLNSMWRKQHSICILNVINECLTLLVLSSEAMFAYTAFCIFLGKVHRPAWRHSPPFSRGHSPKDPDTWPDDTRGPRWRCVLLFYHLVWYTWKITQILGFKLSLTDWSVHVLQSITYNYFTVTYYLLFLETSSFPLKLVQIILKNIKINTLQTQR